MDKKIECQINVNKKRKTIHMRFLYIVALTFSHSDKPFVQPL